MFFFGIVIVMKSKSKSNFSLSSENTIFKIPQLLQENPRRGIVTYTQSSIPNFPNVSNVFVESSTDRLDFFSSTSKMGILDPLYHHAK